MSLKQNIAVKAVAVYVGIGFVVMEVLYLGVWCRPFEQYWAVPPNNRTSNPYSHVSFQSCLASAGLTGHPSSMLGRHKPPDHKCGPEYQLRHHDHSHSFSCLVTGKTPAEKEGDTHWGFRPGHVHSRFDLHGSR